MAKLTIATLLLSAFLLTMTHNEQASDTGTSEQKKDGKAFKKKCHGQKAASKNYRNNVTRKVEVLQKQRAIHKKTQQEHIIAWRLQKGTLSRHDLHTINQKPKKTLAATQKLKQS